MLMRLIYISGKNPLWVNDACDTYCQRVRNPWRLEQYSLPLSKKHGMNINQATEEESDKLLQASAKYLRVALDRSGRQFDSQNFARWLVTQTQQTLPIAFLLGGPSGFNRVVLEQSKFQISLSAMTWPHVLARLMICEQVYRASTIIHGGSYHK